jgi:hypothetical protein
MPLFRRYLSTATFTIETHERFKVEVDWAGDGLFASDYSDLSSDVVGEVQTVRGRDYASQLTGRSVAGSLQVTLRNDDGRYSSFNAVSPIYGSILPIRKVRAWVLTPYTAVLWTGFLDTIEPIAGGGEPTARLSASGILKILGDQASRGYPAPQTNVFTGDVIDAVLDSVGHPAAARSIEDGVVPVGAWFKGPDGIIALEGLQEMEETEVGGWLYEGLNWDVVYEGRYHRLLLSSISQVTFSDAPASNYPYIGIGQQDSVREIYNEITADVTPYTAQAVAVLWTLNEQPYLAPGASMTLKAIYGGNGFVLPWTTPVVATDVVSATGTLAVALVSSSGGHMTFTVTNNHATQGALLTTVQARGIAYLPGSTTQVSASDATSQSKYRKRVYGLGSPWYQNTNYAQSACDYFVSRQKDPHPVLALEFTGSPQVDVGGGPLLPATAANLALSNRVTVAAQLLLTMLGLASVDFYIESIGHSFGAGIPWTVSLLLSPAGVQEQFWLLGDATYGVLGTTTKLAY